jgi:hypothetical protein
VLAACASVVALLVRRWILALVCLVGIGVSLVYMAASTCAFY